MNVPQQPAAPPPQRQSDPAASYSSFNNRQAPQFQQSPQPGHGSAQSPHPAHMSQPSINQAPPTIPSHERSFSQGPSFGQGPPMQYNNGRTASIGSMGAMGAMAGGAAGGAAGGSMGGPPRGPPPGHGSYNSGSISSSGPPQLSILPFQTSQTPPTMLPQHQPTQPLYGQSPVATNSPANQLPPLKPVFGLSLEQLFARDGSAVPMVVYQCIQAVDLFGLEVEGIYRLSGTASHVTKIKAMFDNGAPTYSDSQYMLIRSRFHQS